MNTVFSYFIALILFFVSYLSKKRRSCFSLVFLSIFPVVVLLLRRLNKLLSIWIICHNCRLFDLCPFTIFLVDKSTVGLIYWLLLHPVKTGPSFADAAVGRIAQGTKVLAEGGYEKVFRQTFETVPEEKLVNPYACYLSTSAGPVMGILYLSTAKLAFCSDNPLSYKVGDQTQWSFYKVCWFALHWLHNLKMFLNSWKNYV